MKTPMQRFIEWLDKHGDTRLYGGRELSAHEIMTKARSIANECKDKDTSLLKEHLLWLDKMYGNCLDAGFSTEEWEMAIENVKELTNRQ